MCKTEAESSVLILQYLAFKLFTNNVTMVVAFIGIQENCLCAKLHGYGFR